MNLGGGPSPNDLHSITLWDDLTATGADLTYVDIEAHYVNSNIPVALVPEDNPDTPGGVWSPKNLSYKKISLIPAGEQIEVNITVVLDDSPGNTPGTQFVNTAKWSFGRLIDGVFYEPLPGEWGVSQPLTIVGPADLVVSKTGPSTVINLGEWAEFTIDAWNSGTWAGEAWNVNILDRLPDNPSNRFNGGMCDMVPEVTEVLLAGNTLVQDVDYTFSYAGCELNFTLLEAAGPIGLDEHLVISYRTKVDADSESGAVLTNVAAASQWSNDRDDSIGQTFTCPITDGTEDTDDCQDAHDLLVVLSGYFFEKTAANPLTGEPVTSALTGEWLQYTLSLRSINEPLSDLRFYDDLGVLNGLPAFEPGSLRLIDVPDGADISQNNPNGGTNNAGILDVRNLSVPAGGAIEVVNQAELFHTSGKIADSDDPNISGQADPAVDGDEDPTQVLIYFPQPPPPLKETFDTTVTIGEEISYRITVPGELSSRPLYDVVISDVLDDNLEYLGFTQLSGPSVTDNSPTPDLNFSVAQIPAGQQAVIQVRARLENVIEAQQGITVNNVASYTYAYHRAPHNRNNQERNSGRTHCRRDRALQPDSDG
jgi:fimbrial isopeptide formation D2 family protein